MDTTRRQDTTLGTVTAPHWMPSKPPGWRHSARFTGEDRDSRAEGRVQGSSITKLKSTEVFSYFFFLFIREKKKHI